MYKMVSILIAGALAVGAVGAVAGSSTGHGARPTRGQGVAAAAAPMSDGAAAAADGTTTSTSTAVRSGSTKTTKTTNRSAAASTSTTAKVQLAPAVHIEQGPDANQPMTATVDISPAHPAIGQEVTFTIHGHDPDAANGGLRELDYGDGTRAVIAPLSPVCDRPGDWTPAPGGPHDWDIPTTWTYRQAGTFHVAFTVVSATPNNGGCPDPYASSATAERDITVTPEVTQESNNQTEFTCDPNTHILGARMEERGEALEFDVEGACPDHDPAKASVWSDITNTSNQTVYFWHGLDVLIHLDHNGARQDLHLSDPNTTSLAPGQHVHLSKHVDAEAVGGSYWETGTVSYAFLAPVD